MHTFFDHLAQLDFMPLDVSRMKSVKDFVKAFQQKGFGGLNCLINNAGVMLKVMIVGSL